MGLEEVHMILDKFFKLKNKNLINLNRLRYDRKFKRHKNFSTY